MSTNCSENSLSYNTDRWFGKVGCAFRKGRNCLTFEHKTTYFFGTISTHMLARDPNALKVHVVSGDGPYEQESHLASVTSRIAAHPAHILSDPALHQMTANTNRT